MSNKRDRDNDQMEQMNTGNNADDRRENLEHALNAIERKLRLVLQSIRDIVYMADQNGIITFVNDTVRRFGYTPEELIGTNILDLVFPDDRENAAWHVRERRTGERRTDAFVVRLLPKDIRNDGGLPVVCLTAEGFYDGNSGNQNFLGTVGIVNEITAVNTPDIQPQLPLDIDPVKQSPDTQPRVRIEISDPKNDGRMELVCSLMEMNSVHHLISICSQCKRIRNEQGTWEDFEEYLGRRFNLDFSHGICTACERDLYKDFLQRGDDG